MSPSKERDGFVADWFHRSAHPDSIGALWGMGCCCEDGDRDAFAVTQRIITLFVMVL